MAFYECLPVEYSYRPIAGCYECEVDTEVTLGRAIPLRPTKKSVIRIADIVMRPSRVIKGTPSHPDLLEYVEPKGEGWSDVPFFESIKIIEDSEQRP